MPDLTQAGAVAPISGAAGAGVRTNSTLDPILLLDEIQLRLGAMLDGPFEGRGGLAQRDATVAARAGLLECVEALHCLHQVLSEERRNHRSTEQALVASCAALLQARNDLVDAEDLTRVARQQAALDSLTALPNRRHFGECVEAALVQAAPAGVAAATLYLDLDGFKAINDRHGHHVGDQVLQVVAKRLVRALRAEDSVGRLGGDEFACLLTNLPDESQAELLAGKLFEAVSQPMRIGALNLRVRASIGMAIFPRDGATAEALLRSADEAMYRAKWQRSGVACVERKPAKRASVGRMCARAA